MRPTPAIQEQLKGGLLKALQECIMPGEKVWASLEGFTGQGIVLTDGRVIILKAGLSSGAMFGQKNKGYSLRDITSVEYSCALTEGRVQITVAGSVESTHGFRRKGESLIDQVAMSRQAENVCQFPVGKKAKFQEIAQLIRSRVNEVREQQSRPAVAVPTAPDIPDQIRKLGDLVKQGLLSQEEFEQKRKELLARL